MPCCVPRCVPESGALSQRLVRFPKDYRLRRRWKEVIKQATGIELVEPPASFEQSGDPNPAPLELCLSHMARPDVTDRYQEPARFVDSSGSPLTLLGCRLCLQFVPAHETVTTDGGGQLGGLNLVTAIQRLFGIRIRPDDFQRLICLGCLAKLDLVMAVRNQYRINEFVYETVSKANSSSLEIVEEGGAVNGDDLLQELRVEPFVEVEKGKKRKTGGVGAKIGRKKKVEEPKLEIIAEEVDVEAMGDEFGEDLLEELTMSVEPVTFESKRKKEGTKGKIVKKKKEEAKIVVETVDVEYEGDECNDFFEELAVSAEPDGSAIMKKVKEAKLDKLEILKEALGEEYPVEELDDELFEELEIVDYFEESPLEDDQISEAQAEPVVVAEKGNKKKKIGSMKTKNTETSKQKTVNMKLILSTTCFICKSLFTSRSEMELHLSLEHIAEDDGYTCAECNDGEKFLMVQTYNQHLSYHDHSIRRFKCHFCSMAFSVRTSLRMHENRKHGQNHRIRERRNLQASCDICGKSFAHKGNVWRHKKTEHEQFEGHKCTICNRELSTRVSLLQHMVIHNDKQKCPYTCCHCAKRFKYVSQLHNHKVKNHQAVMNDYLCVACQSRFTSLEDYESHMRELHVHCESYEYSCRLCPEIPQTDQELEHHIAASHASANYPYFKCSICPNKFHTKNQLFKHRKTDHGRFVCEHCGGCYRSRMGLKLHIAGKHLGKQWPHSKTGYTPVQCQECELVCSNAANLRRHQKVVHRGEKPYECNSCQARFAAKLSLQNHIRCTHTGEAPFQCQNCGERFKETSIYSRHRKRCALDAKKSGDVE